MANLKEGLSQYAKNNNMTLQYQNTTRSQNTEKQSTISLEQKKLTFGDNYLDTAEAIVASLKKDKYGKFELTTSKLRKILSMVNEIYNEIVLEKSEALTNKQIDKIKYLRVRIVYEAGRERVVDDFVKKSHLIEYLNGMTGQKTEFIKFSRYLEALVAYHKFLGGRDL